MDDVDRGAAGFRLVITLLLVFFVVAYGVQEYPGRPELSGSRRAFRAVWPQGWGLFADVASSDTLVAYHLDQSRGPTTVTIQQASGRALWGLRRIGYELYFEVHAIARVVPASQWTPCDSADSICRDGIATPTPFPVVNPLDQPTLCGRIALVREVPVAWADSQGRGASWRAVTAAVLDVSCGTDVPR